MLYDMGGDTFDVILFIMDDGTFDVDTVTNTTS